MRISIKTKSEVDPIAAISTKHPLPLVFEKFFRYVNPGIPVLIEYPLELIEPRLDLTLGLSPDLEILIPKPLVIFIRF